MLHGVATINYWANDLDAAKWWYAELGMEPRPLSRDKVRQLAQRHAVREADSATAQADDRTG